MAAARKTAGRESRLEPLPEEAVRCLLSRARGTRWELALLLITRLGLRQSEARLLRGTHFDSRRRTLFVPGAGWRARRLDLSEEQDLFEHIQRRAHQDRADYLIPGYIGNRPVGERSLQNVIQKLAGECGIQDASVRRLRLSCICRAIAGGKSVPEIQREFGILRTGTVEDYFERFAAGGIQKSIRS